MPKQVETQSAERIAIRAIDVMLCAPLLLLTVPSLILAAAKSLYRSESLTKTLSVTDANLNTIELTQLNHAEGFSSDLINIFLGRISFCGVALLEQTQAAGSEYNSIINRREYTKYGIFNNSSIQTASGLVDYKSKARDISVTQLNVKPFGLKQYFGLLAKGIFVKSFYSANKLPAAASFNLHGIEVGNHTMADAVKWASSSSKSTKTAVFVNAHSVNLSFKHADLASNINKADRVFADGSGIRLAAKRHKVALLDNVNGTDMLPLLCEAAAEKGLSVFLLGANHGVAFKAGIELKKQFPSLKIVGVHHGYFDQSGEQSDALISKINRAGADILLLGTGSPNQEAWLEHHKAKLNVSTALAVGGLFDFFSGNIARAPRVLRELGMEWVWRILQEPSVKWKRYVVGNPQFLCRLYFARNKSAIQSDTKQKAVDTKNNTSNSDDPRDKPVGSGIPQLFQQLVVIVSLLILSPFFALMIMAIKLESRGPAFFTQTRVGVNGQRFKLYKFRSMYMPDDPRFVQPDASTSDRDGVCQKFFNDPRITPIGRFIRRFSIDELPQLINVAKGEMVLIGPRPALPQEVNAYELGMYRRLDSKPGLTGLWQVSGRANTTFDEQIALDVSYVDHRSLGLDVKIMLATVPAVLKGEGAY